jgi:hypothetical protein
MRTRYLPLAGLAMLAACGDITVPDYENPPLDELLNPTVQTVRSAATGVLQGTRQDSDTYVRWGGILGREAYFLDGNEDRYVRTLFAGNPSGSNFTGSSYWTTPYRNIRTANLLIAAVDKVDIPASEKEAIKGFARTIQALDFLQLQITRDKIPVQVNTSLDSLTTPPPLAASRAESWAFISGLLDEGLARLTAAGNVQLPFAMPSGLTQYGFTTTQKFAQLNRALKARVEVYRASELKGNAPEVARYQAALTALQGSFIEVDASKLNVGPYQTYSANSGDVANTLSDLSGKTVADSLLFTQAQLQPGGQPDARILAKTEPRANIAVVRELSSNRVFTLYTSRPFFGSGGTASPIPMIRNEELILLRAEARWFTGDKPGAMADLNFIRQSSGGLAAIAQPATDAAFRQALLYERRYSLLFEGSHSWNDWRRFGMLVELEALGSQRPGFGSDKVATWLPLPSNETLPR